MSTDRKHAIKSSVLDQLLFEEERAVRKLLYDYAVAAELDTLRDASNSNTYEIHEGKPASMISDKAELSSYEQIQHEIEKINNELFSVFNPDAFEDEPAEEYLDGELVFSSRYYFLVARRKQLTDKLKTTLETTQTDSTASNSFWEKICAFFEIAKKPIDTTDDVWGAARTGIATSPSETAQKIAADMAIATPYVIGTTGFILATYEANISRKKLEKAINNPNTRLRETKVATNLVATTNFSLASASSIGLMIMAGLKIASSVFVSPVISALMTLGFSARLVKNAVSLDDYKEILSKMKEKHQQDKITLDNKNKEIQNLQDEKNDIREKISTLIHQKIIAMKELKNKPASMLVENNLIEIINNIDANVKEHSDKLKEKTQAQIRLDQDITNLRTECVNSEKDIGYNHIKQKTRGAERKVAAGTLEVTASSMVFVGSLLGVIAATSVASFGAAPLALLITGVVLGSAVKIFEYFDEKNDHKYSNGMRKFFKHGFAKVKSWFGNEEKKGKQLENKDILIKQPKSNTANIHSTLGTAPKKREQRPIATNVATEVTTSIIAAATGYKISDNLNNDPVLRTFGMTGG